MHALIPEEPKSRIGCYGRMKQLAEIMDIGARWGLLVAILAALGDAISIAVGQAATAPVLMRSFLVSAFSLTLPLMAAGAGLGVFIGLVGGFQPLRPRLLTLAGKDFSPVFLLKLLAVFLAVAIPFAVLHDDMTLWFITRFPKRDSAAKVLVLSEYGLLLAGGIVGWMLWKLTDWPLRKVDAFLDRKLTTTSRSLTIGALLLLSLLGGLAVLLTRMVVEFEEIERLSMIAVSALGMAVLLVIGGRIVLRGESQPKSRIWLRASCYGLALLFLILGPGMSRNSLAQAALSNHGPVFRMISPVYVKLGDPDKDQFSSIMGGRDTVPFDPWAYPAAPEIPGNGIDDNCLLGDPPADFLPERDPKFVELPERWRNKPFNILLITLDALRWDHLPFNGYSRDTAPQMSKLAKESVNFSRAYTQGTGTILSIPSFMSGRYVAQLQCTNLQHEPEMRRPYRNVEFLPDYLRSKGYFTALVSATKYLEFFSEIDWDIYSNPKDKQANKLDITSDEITDRAIAEMRKVLPKYKTFAWLHYFDTHDEYVRHSGGKSFGSSKVDLYDGEIHFNDRHIGRLIDEWRRLSPLPTVIIISADHGESLGEHGIPYHNMNFYDSIVRVPLIIQIPGEAPAHIDEPVALMDIAPTLRNLLGDEPDPEQFGRSLLGEMLYNVRDPERLIYHEAQFRQFRKFWAKRGISGKRYKFMWDMVAGAEELYDIENDPKELDNLLGDLPDVANDMRQALYKVIEDVGVTAPVLNNCNYRPPVGFSRYYPKPRAGLTDSFVLDSLSADKPSNVDIAFGARPDIKLVRYELSPETVKEDRKVTVRLYFESLQRIERDYLIFVHARGASGGLKSYSLNYDHWPVQNLLPIQEWPLGKIVVDEFILTIPSGMGSGKVNIFFGFWDQKTNKRLKVTAHPKEISVDDNRVLLKTVDALEWTISAQTVDSIMEASQADKD